MAKIDFKDRDRLIDAFEARVNGFFIQPLQFLRESADKQGALFAAALLAAALIDSIASVEGFPPKKQPIAAWLHKYVPVSNQRVEDRTVGEIFEERFRHNLAHAGYIASRRRLSDDIPDAFSVINGVVTANPFRLVDSIRDGLDALVKELRSGSRDRNRFAYDLEKKFAADVQGAQQGG